MPLCVGGMGELGEEAEKGKHIGTFRSAHVFV